MTKANTAKLNKVAKVLQAFTATASPAASAPDGPVISITDIYTVGNSGNEVILNLLFNTKGVGATTDAFLHNVSMPDKPIVPPGTRDSLVNVSLGIDKDLNGIILKSKSVVTATNLTPVPVALNVEFILSGGQATKNFPLPARQFTNVGDSFIIDYTIIIFQA